MYYIVWKSLITDTVGHGTKAFPKAEALAYANQLNDEYKYLTHWIVPAEYVDGDGLDEEKDET